MFVSRGVMKRQRINVLISKSASRITKFTRGSSVASYLHEKQTSRIQSLYLYFNYFIKIVPFWLRNIRFLIQNTPVIILRVSLFAVTPSHVASTKIECQNFSYVYRSRKHWECKYLINGITLPIDYPGCILITWQFARVVCIILDKTVTLHFLLICLELDRDALNNLRRI